MKFSLQGQNLLTFQVIFGLEIVGLHATTAAILKRTVQYKCYFTFFKKITVRNGKTIEPTNIRPLGCDVECLVSICCVLQPANGRGAELRIGTFQLKILLKT
jgi:hypothetical protein